MQLSEMVFNYDLERSRWNSLPIGGRIEKFVKIDSMSARVYFEYEHNFQNNDVAQKGIIRFAFVPLL